MPYVRCINNDGYAVSLTEGAIYKTLPTTALENGSLRVIDNSGEDYLYSPHRFGVIKLNGAHHPSKGALTVHLDDLMKGILHAEALAAGKSVSALVREWIKERLDLPA